MAINAFAAAANKARAANEERYKQGMSLWDQIIQRYQPGGAFGAGAMASYERGKTKAVGAGMQQLVSSGLANTTVAATIGKKYEEEVGTPFRTQLEDMRMGRLSEAQSGKAGFIERREDVGPDPNLAMRSGMQEGYGQSSGDNFTLPGFNEGWMSSRSPFSGGTSGSPSSAGGSGGGTRAGGGYDPAAGRTLDIGRVKFAGEGFGPSGTGGEAKDGWAAAMRKQYSEFAGKGGFEAMLRGSRKDFATWEGHLAKERGTATKPTTSYASKGGGFGGRGF
jgi:hypothetical protein